MIRNIVNNVSNKENYNPEISNRRLRFSKRNFWKGDIYIEGNHIVKDYRKNSFLSKIFGAVCIHLETLALKKLDGIKGVPSFHSKPSAFRIKIGIVPGTPLADLKKGDISEEYFERLVSLFKQIHSRGVVHGDAHMRNILIEDDWPYIVDFSTAYIRGRIPFLEPGLFNKLILLDRERLYKIEKFFFNRGTRPDMFYIYKKLKQLRGKHE